MPTPKGYEHVIQV